MRSLFKAHGWLWFTAFSMFPGIVSATDLTTVLNPGFLKIEADINYNFLEIFRFTNDSKSSFEEQQVVYPVYLHYGLAQGVELAMTLPVSSRILSSSSEQSIIDRAWDGIGDLEVGTKFKFLSDTSDTPAVFVETLMKIPTGRSRFQDYVNTLYDSNAGITGTDTATFDLILKGVFSMFLDPMELYLQLRLDVRGSDDFRLQDVHEHIDYGSIVSLSGGLEIDLLDNLTLATEMLEISTEASVWTRNGVNALAQSGDSSLLMGTTRTRAGVTLGNTTELYAGPTVLWNLLPATYLKLGVLFGLTPDSDKYRASAGLSTAFPIGILLDFKRGLSLLSPPKKTQVSPAIADLPKPSELPEPAEKGNQQRFIKRQTNRSQRAHAQGNLHLALQELNQIRLQYPDYTPTQQAYQQLQIELETLTQQQLDKAAAALAQDDLASAVHAWHKIMQMQPRNTTALDMLKDYDYDIRQAAKQGYLKGMEFYVNGDYQQAIATWKKTLVFDPKNHKLNNSIRHAKKKLRTLKKLSQ
jgi:hypothetical protein